MNDTLQSDWTEMRHTLRKIFCYQMSWLGYGYAMS